MSAVRNLQFYDRGATPFRACRADERFSYCLYVPGTYDESRGSDQPLLVSVHGSFRVAEKYRDCFRELAEQSGCIVLAPLFPVGVGDPEDSSGYKFLTLGDIRFDDILLAMVEETRARYRVRPEDVLLFGYSGGGQFAHRFLYCHPKRVRAACVGAPGVVTLPDESLPWWVGLGGLEQRMGRALDWPALRRVPVHLVIGDRDLETWEITMQPGHRHYLPGLNDAGATRIDRIRALHAGMVRAGMQATLEIVPGVAHAGFELIGPVRSFFARILQCQPSR